MEWKDKKGWEKEILGKENENYRKHCTDHNVVWGKPVRKEEKAI